MGRPTVFKKGAMTAAERQRRRRKKVARAVKVAEREIKQAENSKKFCETAREPVIWTSIGQAPLPSPVEELVAQVADTLLSERMDANEFRAAFNRRFPV
jgi:hypothetical protein